MNCKQVREEINTASRRDLRGGVRSHLNGCPDCRRYSDETASLLELLSAQPRVEVPTDFEFRLRARMARAQAADESGQRGLLRKILPETFSWGQMAAAAAAVAIVVTGLSFNAGRYDQSPGAILTSPTARVGDPQSVNPGDSGGTEPGPGIEELATGSVKATPSKFTSRSARVGAASYQFEDQADGQADVMAEAASPGDIAGVDSSTRLYNHRTKRLLNDRSRFYGAETVSIGMSKPASAVLTF